MISALLCELHKGAQARGIKKIDLAEIQHCRRCAGLQHVSDVLHELLLGVGIELSGEIKHQASSGLLEASAQRNRQSLQFTDGTSPPDVIAPKCSDPDQGQPPQRRRSAINATKRPK